MEGEDAGQHTNGAPLIGERQNEKQQHPLDSLNRFKRGKH